MGIICSDTERKKEIKKYEEALNIAIDGDPLVINRLEKSKLGIDFSKYKRNIVDLIKEPKEEDKTKNFYDVIVSIRSIKDINKGWKIKFSERFEKAQQKMINEKLLRIGIIGNSNKGKSFILSKLSKIPLLSGTSIKTEGLSIKYPDCEEFKNRNIALLDSAGLETPVVKGNNQNSENDGVKKNKIIDNKEENFINLKENEIKNEIDNKKNNNVEEKDEKEKAENEFFKEKSREKIMTELFLQKYIILNSDILIIVVGLLTYSEQKILNRIKTDLKRSKINKILYIIHNLMTYTTINQVKSYIKETLLKSATFELEKQIKINIDSNNESQKGVCYYEKKNNPQIFHLIFANEGSEAGEYYNDYTLKFIINSFETITDLKEFNILETVKETFKEISKEFIENLQDEIEFDNSKNLIKLIKPKEIKLKKCFIDELGFQNLKANGFEPNYNIYKKGNQIIVKVEAPGNCKIESSVGPGGEYEFIKLKGNKEKDEKPVKIEDNIFNGKELGKFSLDIPINKEFKIKNVKPKIQKKNGIFILSYQLEEMPVITIYEQPKEERV